MTGRALAVMCFAGLAMWFGLYLLGEAVIGAVR